MRSLLLIGALLLAACQQPPALHAPVTGAVSAASQLRAEGEALMAGGNYTGAVEKLRQANDLEPTSVPLRFALGTAYSFLEKQPEAIAQFRWVMTNAAVDAIEHREARRWLVRVGALVEPSPGPGGKLEVASTDSTKAESAAKGTIAGQTQWSGLDPTREPVRMNIALAGDEDSTRRVNRKTTVVLGGPYEFKDVPEGRYRVLGIVGEETIIWDEKVTVEAGKQAEVLLSQASSQKPRFAFPQAPKSQP